MMTQIQEYQILKELDSNHVLIIAKQDTIIANLEYAIENRSEVIRAKDVIIKQKDIQLNIEKARRRKQSWIIGGSLGGALIIGILTSFLIK